MACVGVGESRSALTGGCFGAIGSAFVEGGETVEEAVEGDGTKGAGLGGGGGEGKSDCDIAPVGGVGDSG